MTTTTPGSIGSTDPLRTPPAGIDYTAGEPLPTTPAAWAAYHADLLDELGEHTAAAQLRTTAPAHGPDAWAHHHARLLDAAGQHTAAGKLRALTAREPDPDRPGRTRPRMDDPTGTLPVIPAPAAPPRPRLLRLPGR